MQLTLELLNLDSACHLKSRFSVPSQRLVRRSRMHSPEPTQYWQLLRTDGAHDERHVDVTVRSIGLQRVTDGGLAIFERVVGP